MLLDYKFIKKQGKLSVSYINEKGMKSIMDFNINKFKSYYLTPNGKYTNWDGARCDEMLTDNPSRFDIRTFFEELDSKYKKLFNGRTSPRLYTFDIETKMRDDREFVEANVANMPVHTISVASPELKSLVMGDKYLCEDDIKWIQDQITDFLNKLAFFHTLNLPLPEFKYQYYPKEKDMLEYFYKGIVAKVPILSGWNNIEYDWQYLTTRTREFFPNLSVTGSSICHQMVQKKFTNTKLEDYYVPMPVHTPIFDMKDVIDHFDMSGLTDKESTSLEYISSETPGLEAHKIEYDGDLEILYETDFRRYVFYNAIDSILVQLINYRYKTMEMMYMQALYCGIRIQDAFSKIAISEALTWKDFRDQGYKIVFEDKKDRDRGRLMGAYVAKPIPGLWDFVTCNDFASLYPSTIITCNLSFENFIGCFYDQKKLDKYIYAPLTPTGNPQYIIVGPVVYTNANAYKKTKELEYGEYIGTFIDDAALEPYRKDPNYFVSVNGHVYHNDKSYSFKRVQAQLKATRNISKYLAKDLDAFMMLDIEHILKGITPTSKPYAQNMVDAMAEVGYTIRDYNDLLAMTREELLEFKRVLADEIVFYTCKEQAMKLMGNSMYGGSSHIAFYWFNINVARDITGEARNLIHKMEHHIPGHWNENWAKMGEWQAKWGLKVNLKKVEEILKSGKNLVQIVYGDTDSLYMSYKSLLSTIEGYDQMTRREKLDIIVHLNTDYLDKHNEEFMDEYFTSRHVKSVQKFELETVNLRGAWLNVKKRYCQILLWKDGKYFDDDSLPMKTKGLEMIKASYPKYVRGGLKRVIRGMLEAENDQHLWEHINIMVQKEKLGYYNAPIDDICANQGINGFAKYSATKEDYDDPKNTKALRDGSSKKIVGAMTVDKKNDIIYWWPGAMTGPKALMTYNTIRENNHLAGDPIYGGKCKIYLGKKISEKGDYVPFAYQARNYPKWADEYCPVDRGIMFEKFFLDPLNRICHEAMGMQKFKLDGSRELLLFDF